jgi:hypothetical protein
VPDWIGLDGAVTADRYRETAEREVRGISGRYEAICSGVAADVGVLGLLDTLPPPKRQPNLLLAAVRFLDGPNDSWPSFRSFLLDRWDDVAATMLARRTQTNEPARCTSLLPVLAALPQPLALLEVGASAGLCLFPDRYTYRYDVGPSTHVIGTGPELHCVATGPVHLPTAVPTVGWRAGLDLNPLDVRSDEDMRWLASLVWPEQVDRARMLQAAIAMARADPPRIVQGDLLQDLAAVAAAAPTDATLVVFHSAVLAYVDTADRTLFAARIDELREFRRVCWVSNEAPGVVFGTEIDTGGRSRFVLARDGVPLALSGPHGATLDWLSG